MESRVTRALFASVLSALALVSSATAENFFREGVPNIVGIVPGPAQLPSFSALAKELSSSVVNISVESATASDKDIEAEEEELPAPAPGPRGPQGGPARSLGSGFILSEDGYIVTNNHVIDKSSRIIVRLPNDKADYQAEVIGVDPKTDIALLKIQAKKKLHPVFLGNSEEIEVGDWAVAIGNQFQLGQTVTAGIISAKSRRVPTGSPYDAFIQTDASINPGSSGGPLINGRGQVIGINTAIFSPNRSQFGGGGFNIGIGFAIPINLVKTIVVQLRDNKRVVRGLLGVMIQRVDADIAEALGLPSPDGALVSEIAPNSPASKAGFQRKDVIVSYGGRPITEHDELPLMVASTPVGESVEVEIIRGGKTQKITARIGELMDEAPKAKAREQTAPDRIGLVVTEVTPDIAKGIQQAFPHGVVISEIAAGSVAERAGLAKGDILEEMDGQLITDVETYVKLVRALKPNRAILILVRRAEGTRFLTLRLK